MKDIYLVSMVRVSIPDDASERVEKVLAYMSQHCDDATLVSVAAHFNFHPNTVSGMIKRETGRSFGETLREIRMQRALSLLEARTLPIAQIATLCGYENPSNFYRVFKDTFGMTPRVYMARRDAGEAVFDEDHMPQPAQYVEIDDGVSTRVVLDNLSVGQDDQRENAAPAAGAPTGAPVRVAAHAVRGAASVTVRPDARAADHPQAKVPCDVRGESGLPDEKFVQDVGEACPPEA